VQLNWPVPSQFPILSAGEIHVWALPLNEGFASLKELEVVLSAYEQQRAASFARDEPRRTFITSRAALRSILGHYLALAPTDVSLTTIVNGKPQLAAGDVRFNLAHSQNLTLIGVSRGGEIGIDVEFFRPVEHALEIAARNFHPAERDAIQAADPNDLPTKFLRCWTRKEAIVKAMGVGIGYPLDTFDVLSNQRSDHAIELANTKRTLPPRCWLHDLQPCRDYIGAIATTQPSMSPKVFAFKF
jgi:4'-phosphopantetheinyl transferase